jgi:ketopantoate reductase
MLTILPTPIRKMSKFVIDDLVRPAMLEIIATAKAAGIELPDGIDQFMILLDPTDEFFMPSMGQDAVKVSLTIVRSTVC